MSDIRSADALLQERVDQLVSLSRLSEAVARTADLQATYAAALDCLASTLCPDRASVLVFDEDGVMRFKAWRGLSDAYRTATEGHTPWSPDTRDPLPVLVGNVSQEPTLADLRPVIEAEGIQSLGFFPLVAGDRLLGKFMVYFDSPHAFTPAEVSLAQAIGSHIALEIGRRQAEEELRRHGAVLEAQKELASEGILVVSPDRRVVSFNRAFAEMWRLPRDVLEGGSSEAALEAVRGLLTEPDAFVSRVEYLYAHPEEAGVDEIALVDGRVLERHSSPVKDAEGATYGRVWFFHDVTARRTAAAHAAFLAEASRVLGQSLDYRATLRRLAELAVGFLAEVCAVDLLDDGRLEQIAIAAAASSRATQPAGLVERFSGRDSTTSVARSVLDSGEPELHEEIGEELLRAAAGDEGASELLRALQRRSMMIVPLQARGRTFGAITLIAQTGRRYSLNDLEFACDLAGRAALAADNGLLHEAEARARDAAERLQTVTELLAGAATVAEITSAVVREGAVALGAAAGWIAALNQQRTHLVQVASLGYEAHLEAAYSALPLELDNPTVEAVREDRALWLGSCAEVIEAYPSLEADYPSTGFEAMAIVPISGADHVTGVIALNFTQARAFREDERRLLVALARQCGQALERAHLYGELQERADAASVLAHIGDGVFQLDSSERVTLWNRGAEVITGVSEAEAHGQAIRSLFLGWEAIRPRIAVTDVPLAFGRREALPVQIKGRELWLAISGVASREDIVYAFRDVTEAEKLEKARKDFLATASHELRTPLAGVFGATKTLLHRDLDEKTTRQLLEVIDAESERLAGILDEILFASRLDAGRVRVTIESCDVAALAHDVIELERTRAPEGVTLSLQTESGLPEARCDPARLRQVLLNLLDNAIKYSPEGGAIVVALTRKARELCLSVADQGIGISPGEHERIFEKFYRLDPELSRGVGGTGLGLYICREFITRMNGRIWVESVEGEGSTFHLELPATV